MTKVTYKGNIDGYLHEMESHNTHMGIGGVRWQQMVEQDIPKDALLRLSNEEYGTDSPWMTVLRTVCR